MSSVWIERPCTDPEDLPDVCMRCGAETTQRVSKRFSWLPGWVYILVVVSWPIFLIVALISRKRCRVLAPLCHEHKNHWRGRTLLIVGLLVLCLGVSTALTVATAELLPPGNELRDMAPLSFLVSLLGWLVVTALVSSSAIRPLEISDRGVKLTGVCEDFVEAYEELQDRDLGRFTDEALERWQERRRGRPAGEGRYQGDEGRRKDERYREEP